jgi:hypothetical protein
MAQVIVSAEAVGELLALARRAAFELEVQDGPLSDALTGFAAEVELTMYGVPEHALV